MSDLSRSKQAGSREFRPSLRRMFLVFFLVTIVWHGKLIEYAESNQEHDNPFAKALYFYATLTGGLVIVLLLSTTIQYVFRSWRYGMVAFFLTFLVLTPSLVVSIVAVSYEYKVSARSLRSVFIFNFSMFSSVPVIIGLYCQIISLAVHGLRSSPYPRRVDSGASDSL